MTRILSSLYQNTIIVFQYFNYNAIFHNYKLHYSKLDFLFYFENIQHMVEDLVIVVKLTPNFCALKE